MILCDDQDLGYLANRTRFTPGEGLALDEGYRIAHLPLLAPNHPKVIPHQPGKPYNMGRHERVVSLALPVLWRSLAPGIQPLEAEIKASPLVGKIAWDILPRRQDRLHATLCSAPSIGPNQRAALARLGPITVELRGLFSGNLNVGRLYMRAYPEKRADGNAFHLVQKLLGCRQTDLYLVGFYNFLDDLDADEATVLANLIERWWHRPLLRFRTEALWLLSAADDLVLDANVVEAIPLQ